MIGRALEYMGVNVSSDKTKLKDFNNISDYAKPYVNFFAETDVIISGSEVNFNPHKNLTRGQMAKVLMKALELSDWY